MSLMQQQRKLGLGCLLLLALSNAATAFPQDTESQDEGVQPHFPPMKEVLQQGGPPGSSPEDRMRELFGEVETNLIRIDTLLSDAAAGDTSRLVKVADAGIGSLLQDSLDRGREAQKGIREIIEIAKQLGAQSSSSSSSSNGDKSSPGEASKPGESGSPLDRGQQSQSSEQTPQMAGDPKPGGQSPAGQEPGGEQKEDKPGGEEPDESPAGKDPKSGEEAKGDGQNRAGEENSGDASGQQAQGANAADGWGDLPSHVQETFRSGGRSELPTRYRSWIDDYYRKLNRRRDR
jgi:hypothetical protein